MNDTTTTPIYVGHGNPRLPPSVRRYIDLDAAVASIAFALRIGRDGRDEVVLGLVGGEPGRLRWGDDTWEIVTAATFRERQDYNRRLAEAIEASAEPPDA